MKVYVASSWRNNYQPLVVAALRAIGHEVYDFKNPEPGDNGFHWSEIDDLWEDWTTEEYLLALEDPIATEGYGKDKRALDWCDACVLVLPSGRSAHSELGYTIGARKLTAIFIPEKGEPELMYLMADMRTSKLEDVIDFLGKEYLVIRTKEDFK